MTSRTLNDLIVAANDLANQVDDSLDYRPELRRALSRTHDAVLRARNSAISEESEGGTYGRGFDYRSPRDLSKIADALLPTGSLSPEAATDAQLEVAELRAKVELLSGIIKIKEHTIGLLKELVCDLSGS